MKLNSSHRIRVVVAWKCQSHNNTLHNSYRPCCKASNAVETGQRTKAQCWSSEHAHYGHSSSKTHAHNGHSSSKTHADTDRICSRGHENPPCTHCQYWDWTRDVGCFSPRASWKVVTSASRSRVPTFNRLDWEKMITEKLFEGCRELWSSNLVKDRFFQSVRQGPRNGRGLIPFTSIFYRWCLCVFPPMPGHGLDCRALRGA